MEAKTAVVNLSINRTGFSMAAGCFEKKFEEILIISMNSL